MKRKDLDELPVGKRTRLQRWLRKNNEVAERGQLPVCRSTRKIHAEKNYQNVAVDNDDDDEDVIVVDEAEYLRRVAMSGYVDCASDVSMGVEEVCDDCVVVDVGNFEGGGGYEGCGDREVECVSSGMNPGSEATGGVADGCKVSLCAETGSEDGTNSGVSSDVEDDLDLNDEDYLVSEAELCNVHSPEYSTSDGSEEGGKRKVKGRNGEGEEVTRVCGGLDDEFDSCMEKAKEKESTYNEETGKGVDDNELNVQWPLESGEYGDNENHCELPEKNEPEPEPEELEPECESEPEFEPDPSSNRGGKPPKNRDSAVESKPETASNKGGKAPSDRDAAIDSNSEPGGNRGVQAPKKGDAAVESKLEPGSNRGVKEPKNIDAAVKSNLEPGSNRGVKAPNNRYAGVESMPECEPIPEKCGNYENAGKRKRGRPRKNSHNTIYSPLPTRKEVRKLKPSEAENIMLSTILENGNAGLNSCAHSVTETSKITTLQLKFRFGVEESSSEISEDSREFENLLKELEFALRTCNIGAKRTSPVDENDDIDDCDSAVAHEKLCHEGKHCLIHDDEIGIRCKYCSFVKLDINYVTPTFYKNPFGTSKYKNNDRFPSDNANASDGFRFPESNDDAKSTCSGNTQGSVWELIPGIRDSLFRHQREAFEFMWKNIGGGTKLDELRNPTKFGSGGCIICHAPGTGKTRLAITFLQSFIRMYPTSKPVIIAPKSILLTWEEQFVRWDIDIPFINMNKNELSGNENLEFLNHAEDVKTQQTIRMTKLYMWAMGKGILGISYTLFEKLAGDRKGVDRKIRRVLLDWPGILVLDEGHTARNDKSNIWNVLSEVKTKRRIMLSGTPFQNNFEELLNTLSLVREEFENPLLPGKYMKCVRNLSERRGIDCNVDSDRRIAKLKNMMKSFVHVHKGEILKEKLPGLFHSVVLLKPSDLQKTCFQQLGRLKNGLKLDHLVSIASVHPSLLHPCDAIPDSLKVTLKEHRKNVDAGVKIRFLFDLIDLAEGEKVLVFSQFLKPLKLIGKLLKTRYKWAEGKELLYMDGKQEVKQRQAFIRHFNDPKSEARVLLASTKACCEGIHLVGASRVVLLDVVWNPSVERQAISRAYRLEQKKDVFVYHLITSRTMEEEKYYWQMKKDRVSEKVFSSTEESNKDEKTLPRVSEDRILEEMIQNEKTKNMFAKITYQHKADELIDSFGAVNL